MLNETYILHNSLTHPLSSNLAGLTPLCKVIIILQYIVRLYIIKYYNDSDLHEGDEDWSQEDEDGVDCYPRE